MIELTPGTVLTAASYNEPGQYSVHGQRQNANYYMIDGVSANVGISGGPPLNETANGSIPAFTAFGGTNGMVSEDAMQEFRIQTSTYAPEFGRTPGAQISIVTRSGTNSFHGTAFEYLRNEAFDANDWFANSLGLPRAKMRQNDFGGVFGGRFAGIAPFFFFSYEGLRLLLPKVYDSVVPSLGARQSAIPSMQPLLNAFPLPNGRDFGSGLAQFKSHFIESFCTERHQHSYRPLPEQQGQSLWQVQLCSVERIHTRGIPPHQCESNLACLFFTVDLNARRANDNAASRQRSAGQLQPRQKRHRVSHGRLWRRGPSLIRVDQARLRRGRDLAVSCSLRGLILILGQPSQ